jgi:hypothetical protein
MVFVGPTEGTDCFMWETHEIFKYYLDCGEASEFLLMNCISVNGLVIEIWLSPTGLVWGSFKIQSMIRQIVFRAEFSSM